VSKDRIVPRTSTLRWTMRFLLSASVIIMFGMYIAYYHASQQDNQAAPIVMMPPSPTKETVTVTSPGSTAPPAAPRTAQVYYDGEYSGPRVNTIYGIVQIKAVIQNDQIVDVQFLEFPQHRRTSRMINSIATPRLTQEAIRAQSARVNIISGATVTSLAFAQSLQSALQDAHA
jgi:uncharacterized protein with FMN-binding domain